MQLLRALGFFYVNMFLYSATIGPGIFVTPKGALKYSSQNIPVFLGIWVGCGLVCTMNALCLAEVAAIYPVSGASYYFLRRTLGPCVAFLSIWIKLFTYFLGIGAQCLLVASSLIQNFYSQCPAPELPKKCLALAILWSFGILGARGIKAVAWFNTFSSLIKIGTLCLISITGIVLLAIGKKENVSRFESALDAELPNGTQIVDAILQVYYTYLGSSVLVTIAGEIKRPADTIPKSLIYGLITVTVLYLLTNVSYLTVLTSQEIIFSDSVAVTWMNRVFPSLQWITSLLISSFLFGTVSSGLVSASRIFYSASQEGQLPLIYSMLNDHHSPVVADIQCVILASVAVISSNMIYLMKYVGLGAWSLNLMNMIGLLKLRYQNFDPSRPYKAWLPFVFGSMATSLFLLLTPVIQSPNIEHVYQVLFIFCGPLCYWLQGYLNRHAVCFDRINCYCQLLFNISPSEDPEQFIPSQNPD